ncbi:MAG: hypothetical protein D6704_11445, partial [Nitrospirae bacterium]
MVITNYDPETLSNQQRVELHEQANKWPPDEIFIDIRSEFPGGDFPFTGTVAFRSFVGILEFLGRGIVEDPEYPVPLDPRTPPFAQNPAKTLEILETTMPLDDSCFLVVRYNGHYYGIKKDESGNWNCEAFRLLYH